MQKFKPTSNNQIFLLPPSVDEFVKEGHLARLINEVLDKLDTSSIEKDYSYLGQKSYPPRLLLKLWFYGYATGTLSGREIARKCESDTAYMFLASMYTPDFRTVNDFRKDNALFFTDCFKQVLQICRELGMGKMGLVAIDGTKMRANASAKKNLGKASYQQWLTDIDKQIDNLQQQADEINAKEDAELGNQRGDELPKELQQKQQLKRKIEDALEKIKSEDKKINLTDNDSQSIKCSGVIKPAYNCQAAVSEDGIIVAVYATNKANDKEQLRKVIEQVEANTLEKAGIVLADSGYSSYDNYQWLQEQKNINAFIPDQEEQASKDRMENPYDRAHFIYDAIADQYICPEGQTLQYTGTKNNLSRKQHYRNYEGISCYQCPQLSACTRGTKRQIHQELREPLRQGMREKLRSPEGKAIYKQRLNLIEHVWGNFKFNYKVTMFKLRGLQKVNAETQLLAIGHNLKKLLKNKQQLSFG